MIEMSLVAFLKADPAVNTLCGGRIYPQKAPQAKNAKAINLPRIVYERTSTDKIKSQDGPSKLTGAHVTLYCQADKELVARNLAFRVENSSGGIVGGQTLNGFKGTMQGMTAQGVFLEDQGDGFTDPFRGDDVGVYEFSLSFVIWYLEPATV
jgi:hypothetical protein